MIKKTNNFFNKKRDSNFCFRLNTFFSKPRIFNYKLNAQRNIIKKREIHHFERLLFNLQRKNLYAVRGFPDHFDILIDVHVMKRVIYRYLVWPTVLEHDVLTIDCFVCQKCAKKQSFGTLLD